jgi:hypothetical protein
MLRALLRGAAAGAAGTTALNAVTYLDMAARARPASELPQQAVAKISEQVGHPVAGAGEQRQNRLQGLGPLAGIAAGIGVGCAAGLCRPILLRLPTIVGAGLIGAAAMAATDVPMSKLDLTDVTTWTAGDWISDVVPHFAYGLVTRATLRQISP